MKNLLKDNFILLKKCGKTLVIFELIYKAVAAAVGYPLFLLLFKLSFKIVGIKYLTNGYIARYFTNPFIIAMLILLVFLAAIYNFFEKCCMSAAIEAGVVGKRIGIYDMFYAGMHNFRSKFKLHNTSMVLYEIFLFPFSNIIILGLVMVNLTFPEYITRVFGNKNIMYLVILLVCFVLFALAIREIFTPNYLIYGSENVKDAYKRSASLIRRRTLRTIMLVLFWNVMIMAAVGALFLVISLIVIGGSLLLNFTRAGMAIYLTVIKGFKNIITFILVLISTPASYLVISSMFFRYRKEIGRVWRVSENTQGVIDNPVYLKPPVKVGIVAGTVISGIMICVYIFVGTARNPFDKVELLKVPEISAHRGSSGLAPENTMSAFKQALYDLADYVELDVHLTSDNVVVVMHDSNLKRTTGVNKNIWQVSYDRIKELDAGGWFSADFAGEQVPTLEEVIKEIGPLVKLNIEIKYNKRERGLTEAVVDIIERNRFEDRCIVTSSDYSVLSEVKKLNSDIKTGYVLSAAYGAYYSISYVDVISINYSFVNKALVDSVHRYGKELYVWTVNAPSIVKSLANMGVDNIITDNPVMAREAVYSRYTGKELINILDYVFSLNGY